MKEVTIITVSYKSSHIICDALDSIVNKGYRIIVVDNGSNDDIEQVLKDRYPGSDIELIILKSNCGFGRANNVALKMVKTKFSLLLNPDAIIHEESIDNLVKYANKDKKIALASPLDVKNIPPSNKEINESIENHKRAFGKHLDKGNHIETEFRCGGFLLLKIEVLNKIGFFDKKIFLYFEDSELCKRSIKEGHKNILVKNSFCKHFQSTSTATKSLFEKYLRSPEYRFLSVFLFVLRLQEESVPHLSQNLWFDERLPIWIRSRAPFPLGKSAPCPPHSLPEAA